MCSTENSFWNKHQKKLKKCNLAEILDDRVQILDFKTSRKVHEVLKSKIVFCIENHNLKLSCLWEMNI